MKKLFANTIPGLLLGVWVALHVLGCDMIWVYTMSLANNNGFKTPATQNYNETVIAWVIAIILSGMVSSAIWRQMDKSLQFDPHGLSADCISWCKKVLAKPTNIAILLASMAIMVILYRLNIAGIANILCIPIIFLIPFSILKAEVIGSDSVKYWWIPKWPGIGTAISFGFLFLFVSFYSLLTAHPGYIFTILLSILVFEIYLLVLATIFINKISIIEAFRSCTRVMTWRIFGPLLALQAKIVYISLYIAAPVLSLSVLYVFVVPTYAKLAADDGVGIPIYFRLLIDCAVILGQASCWIGLVVTATGFFLFGRMVWLLKQNTVNERTSNNGADTDAPNPAAQVTP